MTTYDGVSLRYDPMGNPPTYYNGTRWNMAWENGRQLKAAMTGGKKLSFTYNDEGIRTSKTVNGVVHTYRLNGSQIVAEEWTATDDYGTTVEHMILFLYDAEGAPVGMQYRNQTYAPEIFDVYWFEKNLQGDVMYLVDGTGATVAAYEYDPYGNIVSATGPMAEINPLRYRGYYYDAELEMYYLQSRYYDPMVGRFINADMLVSTGQGIIGYNMFAYCGNNSICRIDSVGTIWMSALRLIVKIVIKALKVEQPQKPSYLVNQDAEGIGNLRLGWTTVSHGGCGVLATYNALITLGEYPSFENVLSYYNQWGNNVVFGLLGIVPETVVKYFKQKGYKVIVSDNLDGIDIYSTTADACILWYTWIHDDGLPRAHFVHYNYDKGYSKYCAYNAGPYGWAYFKHPSEYILKENAFYAVGIFIYR